uniref:HTH cro/C1-type domain-containing protein n=1 Tax=Micromonas pusilla TaxID=38833 RepID=A0A7S0KTA1_MICPS|mmetsp:Transcript_3826/g.14291  ORF Transcript_3826/g.14291 Transcript_3826/m.14291 type:complete len:131 (+) Transcript_3826:98-490(+)
MDGQDWNQVVLTKKRPTGGMNGVPKSADAARRMGMQVQTVKKQGAGYNAQRMGKLENETEELSHAKVGGGVKKAIMQGRLAKKMTQAQVAQMINEKPQIIQEYESGKAIPNQQILAKLERILGVKLRGLK